MKKKWIVPLLGYLFMIAPRFSKRRKMKKWKNVPIAHRGLYNEEAPENTLRAISRAVEAGYGIEFDVRILKDNTLIIHHDSTMERSASLPVDLNESTYDEVKDIPLFGSDQTIPLFSEVLQLVGGKVPLLIELKCEGKRMQELASLAYKELVNYSGEYVIESFYPQVLFWYRKNAPQILRGQLSDGYHSSFNGFLSGSLFINAISRPDFISYNHKRKHHLSNWLLKLVGTYYMAYTIRSQEEWEKNQYFFDNLIFEGFKPKEKAN